MNTTAFDFAANDLAANALPREAFKAAALREGMGAVEIMRAYQSTRQTLAALAAHCIELNDIDSGAAAERERVAHEARMAKLDEVRARRAAALQAPTLMVISSVIAVSVAPVGDPLHAAHLRHSVGEERRRYTRTPDGRVSAVRGLSLYA